ncbi:platelet endothelial aggregation receptor 1-like isoform X2 [Lineus longissimus]|uniref:platelet endothelial aggregation receptor 1-like isoform X2 n=1 Tax=Lineus longissimus TaxID=88925 RepID=UPI002B4DFFB0
MISFIGLLFVGLVAGGPVHMPSGPPLPPAGPPTYNGRGEVPFISLPSVPKNGTVEKELDLILTEEQHEMLFDTEANGRTKRKAWKGEKFRWTNNVVPYSFNGNDYTEHQKKEIREAMDVYEADTCLKFRPATSSDVNKVLFRQGQGCNSQLGMVGGSQDLNLDQNGCRWKGLYWHEIGHAIGLVHEHQLPERDQYIKINWNNVNAAFYSAFSKYKTSELDRFGIGYDYSSVMHYEIKAFSQTGGQTIVPRNKAKEPWIGDVWISQMSFTDVMIVNRMYKCAEKCPKISCEGGFVNKECKCVTPKSYFDSHCINEHNDEEECYERAHKGDCDMRYDFMNFKCRKACDRCAMYGMEDRIKGQPGECYNQYFDDARCDAWAAAGDCDKYPSWMKRQCKKSCGTCNSEWGQCKNLEFDHSCDAFKKRGECDANPEWMKNKCPDSCGTCGYITRGKCENTHKNEDECFKWSREGQCNDDDLTRAFWMRENCQASCNSCDFNQGKCENELDDFECSKLAFDGGCSTDARKVRKECKKACNSCDYGVRGPCKNLLGDDGACNSWADGGSCDFNLGWYLMFCASSCNKCGAPEDLQANCRDLLEEDKCRRWVESGECDANAGFTRYNCAKSCRSCHLLTTEKICADVSGEYMCKFWYDKGECENNPSWMKTNCRLTCGKCEAGERIVKDPGWPKCENMNPDESCDDWAKRGECSANAVWMNRHCGKACDAECGGVGNTGGGSGGTTAPAAKCTDDHKDCKMWAATGQCKPGNDYMWKHCSKYCKPEECGGRPGGTTGTQAKCTDNHKDCKMWAETGQCKPGNEYMWINCSKYCKPDEC